MSEPNATDDLLKIGEFSRRTRLSAKALRLYDAMGLLAPAHVDPESGYRYYLPAQVETARLIGLLRQLEMPLDRIAGALQGDGAAASREIARYWKEVESDVRAKRRLVRYLGNYLEGKGQTMFEVHTRHVPEQKVATIQGRAFAKELPSFIQDSMDRLLRHLKEAGLAPAGAPFVAYHGQVDVDSDGPVETCIPVSSPLEPTGDMRIRVEPAHDEAYTRLTKAQVAFPGILEAYDAVRKHVGAEFSGASGSPREVYFADWGAIGDDDPACDVAYPYQH